MFFDDGLEILRGRRFAVEGLAIVLHHVLEVVIRISASPVPQLHLQHVQHIGALGIHEILISPTIGFR